MKYTKDNVSPGFSFSKNGNSYTVTAVSDMGVDFKCNVGSSTYTEYSWYSLNSLLTNDWTITMATYEIY